MTCRLPAAPALGSCCPLLLLLLLLVTAVSTDVPGLRFSRVPESSVSLPGAEVTLECALNVTADRVEWRHNGRTLSPPPHASSRLVVRLGSHEHANTGSYQCIAWFGASALASPPAELQRASLSTAPLSPARRPHVSYTVAPGNVVPLSCPPPPSTPPAVVRFARDGRPITAAVSALGSMLLTGVSREDSGVYTCSASNPMTGETVELPQRVTLRVDEGSTQSSPPIFLAPRVNNYTVLAGSDVALECPAVGWPVPKATWNKYGGSLPPERTDLLPGALLLRSVTSGDEGTYICEASNGVGSPASCVIMLHVQEPPSIVRDPASLTVEEGGEARLECSAQGQPEPAITWVHNGDSVDKFPHVTAHGGQLVIRPVEKKHAGIFQCFATSPLGSAFGLAMLQVQPRPVQPHTDHYGTEDLEESPRPGSRRNKPHKPRDKSKPVLIPPSRPNITRLSDESVMVRWSVPPGDGLSILFFKVQYRDMGRHTSWKTIDEDIPPHIRSFEVDTLIADHTYKFRIAAVYSNNDNKQGPNSAKFHLQKEVATKKPLYPPNLIHGEAVSPSAIEIEWEYTEVASTPIEGFFIYYRSTTMAGDYTKATVLGENTRSYLITHLLPDNAYDIKMQSFNMAGASDFSAIRSYRTQYVPTPPEPSSQPPAPPDTSLLGPGDGSSQQLGMVIGIVIGGMLLFVLTVCLGVFLCKQFGARTAAAEHDPAKDAQAYGLTAVGKPLTNGTSHHLHQLHHRHHPRVHITANPLATATDHYKSDGELDRAVQNNNCAALLEHAAGRRRGMAAADSDGPSEDEGEEEEPPPAPPRCLSSENYV